jgi:hypothetical protein
LHEGSRETISLHSRLEWTEVVEERPYGRNFESAFGVKYTSADEWHPHGFSGGGVWFGQAPKSDVWSPEVRLGGIIKNYYSASQLLECVEVERVIEFLRSIT